MRRKLLIGARALLLAGGLLWLLLPVAAPLPEGTLDCSGASSTRVLDREGRLLHEVLSPRGERFHFAPLPGISPHLRRVVVASEDKRFPRHPGVDPLAVGRACWQNLRAGRVVSGGSTITQQLARHLLGDRPRTLRSKLAEAWLALRLERQFGKDELLEAYLNRIPLGSQFRGVGSASSAYFGEPPAHLTLAQSACLAVIPRSPDRLDPWRDPEAVRREARALLGRLSRSGAIGELEAKVALAEEVRFREPELPFEAPHLVRLLQREGWGAAGAGGAPPSTVRTTVDRRLQREVEAALGQEVDRLERHGVRNGAVVVLENATGRVLAFVGSRDFSSGEALGQNDGCTAPRQPGSALKPFTYALALTRGMTLAEVIPDVEAHFPAQEGDYSPRNFNNRFYGPVRAREALANSLNVSAVKVAQRVGAESLLEFLRGFGFTTLDRDAEHYGLGLTLGNAEVRLLELTAAYCALARGGATVAPALVEEARDGAGSLLPLPPPPPPRQAVTPEVAYQVADALSDENARIASFGVLSPLNFPFRVAVKTGTSRDFTDNWCLGFTPQVTVGVWVGNFDSTPMRGVSGVAGAGPVFNRVMSVAMEGRDKAWFDQPEGLTRAEVCTLSGKRPGPACRGTIAELFPGGAVPSDPCDLHREVAIDARNGLRADGSIPPRFVERESFAVFPARYLEWARSEGVPVPPAAYSPFCASAPRPSARRLALLYPDGGETFILDPVIPLRYQTILPRLDADEPEAEVEWLMDGRRVGSGSALRPVRLPLSPGSHRVEVVDLRTGARSPQVAFQVVDPEDLGYFW